MQVQRAYAKKENVLEHVTEEIRCVCGCHVAACVSYA